MLLVSCQELSTVTSNTIMSIVNLWDRIAKILHVPNTSLSFCLVPPSTLPVRQSRKGPWKAPNTESTIVLSSRLTTSFSLYFWAVRARYCTSRSISSNLSLGSMACYCISCSGSSNLLYPVERNKTQLVTCYCWERRRHSVLIIILEKEKNQWLNNYRIFGQPDKLRSGW